MKKLTILLFALFLSINLFAQVSPGNVLRVFTDTSLFVSNVPQSMIIINSANGNQYVTLVPIVGTKSISTCALNTELKYVGDGTVLSVAGGYGLSGTVTSSGTISADTTHLADKIWVNHIFEPKITTGTTSQYWRGDKSWQTLSIPTIDTASLLLSKLRATHDYQVKSSYEPAFSKNTAFNKNFGTATTQVWGYDSHPTTVSGYGITDIASSIGLSAYLPLSAGSGNALTGTLYGTGASFSSTTASTSSTTGALVVAGGGAFGGNSWINGKLTVIPNVGNLNEQVNITGWSPNVYVDDMNIGFNTVSFGAAYPTRVNASNSAWNIFTRIGGATATDNSSGFTVQYFPYGGGAKIDALFLSPSSSTNVNATFSGSVTATGATFTTGSGTGKVWTDQGSGVGGWASLGGAAYKGQIDGSTGSGLADGTGTNGWYYACSTAGTHNYGSGNITLAIGDQLYYNGSIWLKIPGAGSYTLPAATTSTLGGVIAGSGVSVSSGTISVSIAYRASSWVPAWSDISGTTPTWNQSTTGTASNVTGTVAVANGGTGSTTASGARTNLGLAIGSDVLAYRTFGTAANSATGDFVAYRTFGSAANSATTDFVAARSFGTAANNNTGDFASSSDSRLSDSRNAADVYSWAKASTKPSYAWSEISSKPTALSSFTNDLGNYGGWITGYTETDPSSIHTSGGTMTGDLYGVFASFGGLIVGPTSSSVYGMSILGTTGGARKIFLAGETSVTNGFTIDYNGSTMAYAFNMGDVQVTNLAGTGDRMVTASSSGILGTGLGVSSGSSTTSLYDNTGTASGSGSDYAVHSRIGTLEHGMIQGTFTSSGAGSATISFIVPLTSLSNGIIVGHGVVDEDSAVDYVSGIVTYFSDGGNGVVQFEFNTTISGSHKYCFTYDYQVL